MMTFTRALQEVMKGRKLTRESWDNDGSFMLLHDGWLKIYNAAPTPPALPGLHAFSICEADLQATDWNVVTEAAPQ
jgi:hypothetical protein